MQQPPKAAQKPFTRNHHGRTFVDNYEWLRDKGDPETIAYLEAENSFVASKAGHLNPLRDTIYQEIKSRVQETDMSVPVRAGDWWYYGRTQEGKAYGLSCRLPVDKAEDPWTPPRIPADGPAPGEEVILDLNDLAQGHDFFSIGASSVTTSGRYLAYSTDTTGDERFTLSVKDLTTGELLDDQLTGIFYGATWLGEEYLFYQTVDDAWRPDRVWRHRIGTPQDEDVLVFHEPDERFNVGVGGMRSEKFLVIESASKVTSEIHVLDTATPEGSFDVLWPREPGVEYSIDEVELSGRWHWVVTHNATGPNFAVGTCPVDALAPLTDLDPLVPHRADVRIEGVDTYRDQMVLAFRRGGIGRLAIMDLRQGFGDFEEVSFDEELYSVAVSGNPEWDAPVLRMVFSSFTTPTQVLDYVVATGERILRKEQVVRGGYDRDDYVAYRLWSTARDGTQLPVSVVHRASLDVSKPQPMLLYAYGAYESSTDPGFSVARLSLMDRGMIFAVAHVRGGGEMGRSWYDDGKLLNKKNSFFDFIDVADDLIARGLTTPEHLVAEGGSAGGMLMGAVANIAPDRFRGIQAIVPFVDPLTSMLMPELPLTVTEWDEWGDPLHDPEVYDYMASYSAYENVAPQVYPDILAVTSLNDTRVLYVEPAKWIARLREIATGGEFLLQTEMSAGHGGVSGRYDRWKQTAFEYAWTLSKALGDQLEIPPGEPDQG